MSGCCNASALGENETFKVTWLVNALLHGAAAFAKAWLEKMN